MKVSFFVLLTITVFFSSCASRISKKNTNPANYSYYSTIKNYKDSIEYAFDYDNEFYNFNYIDRYGFPSVHEVKRFLRKQKRKEMCLVAVRITNISSLPITINKDQFSVFCQDQRLKLYSPNEYYNVVKQKKGYYFLWSLMGPIGFLDSGPHSSIGILCFWGGLALQRP